MVPRRARQGRRAEGGLHIYIYIYIYIFFFFDEEVAGLHDKSKGDAVLPVAMNTFAEANRDYWSTAWSILRSKRRQCSPMVYAGGYIWHSRVSNANLETHGVDGGTGL